jgi:hypothetical protein
MLQIAKFFWQMCLLRNGPQNLPSSNFVTGFTFFVYLVTAFTIVNFIRPSQTLTTITGTIAIGISLQALVTYLLLQFKNLTARFRATWSALLGTNTIMLLVLLPFNFIILKTDNEQLQIFANSATLVCLGWWLAIAGYIYHKSAGISILQGSVIAFMIEILGVIIAYNLFPE